MKRRKDLARMARFILAEGNGCTRWLGGKNNDGYPMFWLDGKTIHGARALWIIVYGEIPEGLIIRHSCDNPECLNLSHLELGTPKQNTADALARNRMTGPRKVDSSLITKINHLRTEGYTIKQIQAETGLSTGSIYTYLDPGNKRVGNYRRTKGDE